MEFEIDTELADNAIALGLNNTGETHTKPTCGTAVYRLDHAPG